MDIKLYITNFIPCQVALRNVTILVLALVISEIKSAFTVLHAFPVDFPVRYNLRSSEFHQCSNLCFFMQKILVAFPSLPCTHPPPPPSILGAFPPALNEFNSQLKRGILIYFAFPLDLPFIYQSISCPIQGNTYWQRGFNPILYFLN